MSIDLNSWLQKVGRERAAILILMAEHLTEKALKKEAPFDRVHYPSALEPYFPYIAGLPDSERVLVLADLIDSQKAKLGGPIYIDRQRHERLLPFEKARTQDFAKNYIPYKLPNNIISSAKVREILTGAIKVRYPDFKSAKCADKNILRYAKEHPLCGTVDLLFDQGTFGPGLLSPVLGVSEPSYMANLGDLAGITKTSWRYATEAECVDAVDDILTIVGIVLPVFMKTVEEAIFYARDTNNDVLTLMGGD